MSKKHILKHPEHKQKNRFSLFFSHIKWAFWGDVLWRSNEHFEDHWPEKHTLEAKKKHSEAENMLLKPKLKY